MFFVAPSDRDRWQAPGGEEILVLDSVFPDEHGDDPAGTWLHHPPGSRHAALSSGIARVL